MKRLICLLLLIFATAVAAQDRPLHTPPKAVQADDIRQRFIGTWRLVSTERRDFSDKRQPFAELGPNARGYLMYDTTGHMCASLMRPDRPKWDNLIKPTDQERISAIDGFIAYCGTYEVDEVRHVMVHRPDVAWTPNYLGTTQERPYRFENGRLIYSGKDMDRRAIYTLVWERVK